MTQSPPGVPPYADGLMRDLLAAYAARGAAWAPRTRHLLDDGRAKYVNRLVLETSPYLLQHAHNPVNWYAWGDEAFEEAKARNVPVLLSIGYSTCHWCHVMEHESFEDEQVAAFLNERYVPIKVDREERPDVDAIYMNAVQMLTGHGGWPMTVWLTHDRKPYYGGTYFPARDGDRGSPVGFLSLLDRLSQAFHEQPDRVASSAARVAEAIRANLSQRQTGDAPTLDAVHEAMRYYTANYDDMYGGMAGSPKFPSSLPVRLFLRYVRLTNKPEYREMAANTLRRMAAGGMYDHVAGGFHRYSVDEAWLVPHFEKMLYDNALLLAAYLEGWQTTGDPDFERVAREIVQYVARDMTSPEGAFYSATDADSVTPDGHMEEGWFFTWTPDELADALGGERAGIVSRYYAVTPHGNFEGRNILNTPRPIGEVARELSMDAGELRRVIDEAREWLLAVRAGRPAPLRDEKILASWNGLMIQALARAGLVLDDPDAIARATRAADFVLSEMRRDGRLFHTWKDGRARHRAYLDDYAFMIAGLLSLFEATGDVRWFTQATALQTTLDGHYADEAGGYFMTANDHEALLAREKPAYDGAEPSGNSIACQNLLRLHAYTADDAYRARADKLLSAFSPVLERAPVALSEMLIAIDFRHAATREVVLVRPADGDVEPFLEVVRENFLPHVVLAVVPEGDGAKDDTPAQAVPITAGKTPLGGAGTAYVCRQGACERPATDTATFREQLGIARHDAK
ncbi:thioredoxin domain-containing protein [bacterium]|nr:thioredoxin domain-containing protein [bacterium]